MNRSSPRTPWTVLTVAAVVLVVSAAGELLGTLSDGIAPDEGRQINDVFGAFGVDGCDLCRIEFEVSSAIGRDDLYVWGSVVDTRSGDAIFVHAIPY